METPKRKVNKLSVTYRSSTPKNESNIQLDNDYSPLFMSNTQDCIDSVDVVWDWNSPQAKGKIKSDNKPIKRLSSSKLFNNSAPPPSIQPEQCIPSFNNLKEQLERLRNQLILDNAERRAKEISSNTICNKSESPRRSISVIPKPRNLLVKSFSSESLGSSFFEDDFNISEVAFKSETCDKNDNPLEEIVPLDIDTVLDEFQDEDYELLSQAIEPLKAINNNVNIEPEGNNLQDKSKVRIAETAQNLSRKSKNITNVVTATKQYSQEEIEKKRKLALSKLEERRIEDIIEKKRQQALMRLESNRKKHLKFATTAIKRYNSS